MCEALEGGFMHTLCQSDSDKVQRLLDSNPLRGPFSSSAEFNAYCKRLVAEWNAKSEALAPEVATFERRLRRVENGFEGSIPTGWGGVDVLRYDHPFVEKYLLVKKGYYLSYEMHDEKREDLWVHGGVGVLVSRPKGAPECSVEPFTVGSYAHFSPRDEHCIIALEDLIVFESSEDFRGMDKDLIFLFEPE